jgi:hypothetical protein
MCSIIYDHHQIRVYAVMYISLHTYALEAVANRIKLVKILKIKILTNIEALFFC